MLSLGASEEEASIMEASPPFSGNASSLISDASAAALVGMTLTSICRIEPD